jgi:hypothetical protein
LLVTKEGNLAISSAGVGGYPGPRCTVRTMDDGSSGELEGVTLATGLTDGFPKVAILVV